MNTPHQTAIKTHRRFPACGLPHILLLTIAVAGCAKRGPALTDDAPLPTAAVRVAPVENKASAATEDVVGTVRSKRKASLEAKVSGRIATMPVNAGQSVKTGDLVARLEVREIQARLDQARALRDQAQSDLQRFERLLQGQAVTRQEYGAVRTRARVAAANTTEAEAMLDYATVTAPFDGVIVRKLADEGDLASPGRPLVEVEDPASLRLEADVPEAIAGGVHLGAQMPARVDGIPGPLKGTVSEIAPAADPNSRTFRVKFDLPANPGLRSGQFGHVAVPVGDSTSPRVPTSAIVVRGQMEMVFVVTDRKAHLRLVKTGKQIGNETELLSGATPGEQVVTEGAAALLDGQPLTLK